MNHRINIEKNGWEEANTEDILKVLISSIELFEENILPDNFNSKLTIVRNSHSHNPPISIPRIYRYESNSLVFLSVKNRFWAKYAYQFAHEYCHHQIESNFINSFDQFGWFEESLCELASIHSLKKMARRWESNPPYACWDSYSTSLSEYADEIINRESNEIELSLSNWIKNNIEELENDRCIREKNCIVAANILDIFTENPNYGIQFLTLKM